jgi:uncharacterized protein YuzE
MKIEKVTLDAETKTAYITLRSNMPGEVITTIEIATNVLIDLGKDDELIGIELLNPYITGLEKLMPKSTAQKVWALMVGKKKEMGLEE